MPFVNVFLKTLGLLIGISTFLILINVFIYFLPDNNEDIDFVEGDKNSINKILTLSLNGPIVSNFNRSLQSNIVRFIDPELVRKYLNKIKKINPKILIININSPGGTVTAVASLEAIISEFKQETETEVYFYSNEILASGGYWIATSGSKIFANYGSIIGSIGVSGPSWYYFDKPMSISTGLLGKEIQTKNGIYIFDQNAGPSKDLYNPFRKPTTKELDHLQNIVLEIYNDFIIKVSESRKIEIDVIKNDIGALIFTSKQAKENFLIDDVIDYNNLIKKIIKENNYSNYQILSIKIKQGFLERYLESYIGINSNIICNKLNFNFVSILPLYLKNC